MSTLSKLTTANRVRRTLAQLNTQARRLRPFGREIDSPVSRRFSAAIETGLELTRPRNAFGDGISIVHEFRDRPQGAVEESAALPFAAAEARTRASEGRDPGDLWIGGSSRLEAIRLVIGAANAVGAGRLASNRLSPIRARSDREVSSIAPGAKSSTIDAERLASLALPEFWSGTDANIVDRRTRYPTSIASRVSSADNIARLKTASFAELALQAGREDREAAKAPLTLHSSPTIVVHGATDLGDIEHRIAGALRRHREELFDQMKREAARRERTCF